MNRENLSSYAKGIVILLGAACLALALTSWETTTVGWGLVLIMIVAGFIAPRMSLELPGSRFAINFSEASVVLAFLYYGGPTAIVVAAVDMLGVCWYLRSKGFPFRRLMIPTNVSISVVSMSATYLIWQNLPIVGFMNAAPGTTQHLLVTIGSLAIVQFAVSSSLAAALQSLSDGSNMWSTWKRDCFSSSMTQIVGAGVAGVVYKVINYGDVVTAAIAFVALGIAYFSYRQSIGKIADAIEEAESAGREKAETEFQHRVEAERHAAELALALDKEGKANAALRKSEADLQRAALYDSLTDLPNRKHFGNILGSLIEEYKQRPGSTFHVLFLDIRKFKNINDSLGHSLGDKVLMIAAKRFVRMLNNDDLVARIGGDEFAVILKGLSTSGKAQKVARRILSHISQPFSLSGNRISISVNIGIAACDTEYETPEEVLRDADIAMHYAKERDTGVAIFTKELRVRFLERVRFEDELRHALDRNELSMSYQPLVSLADGELFGYEALLRWNHSEFGLVPPNKFIPIAEESGLILPITSWILRETAIQLSKWQKVDPVYRNMIMSVNISGKHLSNDDLIDDVEAALAASKIDPSCLKLEITESAAMENAEHTIDMLNRLKQLGVQLSIDDFGTGYSSLSYLHRLPFDTLKIDRSFVYRVGESGENSEILQTIISLAKNLKKKVIAEGIETHAQLALLQNLGCDYGQGYLLARPMTKDKAESALYEGRSWLPSETVNGIEKASESPRVEDSLPVF